MDLRLAWDYAAQGVILFDKAVTYINPAAAQMLEVEVERVLGKPLLLALRHHHLEQLCIQGGEATLRVRNKTLRVQALPEVLLLWDETEAEKQKEALEESSRMLAHEFRTPVTGMLSLIEALQHGLSETEQLEVLDMLHQEAQRLARLVEDLPLHRTPQRERTFPICELQPRLERFLAPLQSERSAYFVWNTKHLIHANPDAVYQVLLNLLENALRYATGPEIIIDSDVRENHLYLEVRDRGAFLDSYESLFEKGQRGLHAAHVQGSGLGLALVKRMAEAWGGTAYGRAWEQGNAFGVSFPLRSDDARQF